MRRFNHSSNAASSYRPRMASLTAADTSWSIQMLLEEPANERAPDVSGAWPAVNADTMDLDALLEDDLTEDGAEYALSDEELELCEDGSQWITPVLLADSRLSVGEDMIVPLRARRFVWDSTTRSLRAAMRPSPVEALSETIALPRDRRRGTCRTEQDAGQLRRTSGCHE